MSNNINLTFIETYKRFEKLAKSKGYSSAKGYEEFVNEKSKTDASKLKLCRTVYNFLTYTSKTFIDVSQDMLDFILKQIDVLDDAYTPIKEKMISIAESVKSEDLITSAVNYMLLKGFESVPVFDKKGYAIGSITYKDVATIVASGKFTKAKTVAAIVQKTRFSFCSETTPINQLKTYTCSDDKSTICLVVNDDKKVVGWAVI